MQTLRAVKGKPKVARDTIESFGTIPTRTTAEPRGLVAIPFTSRDACSDSIAKLFCVSFNGASHNYCAMCCKMRYHTDVFA